MVTVADIIAQAYRKIGTVGHGQTATGEQAEAGLDAYNNMVQAWRLDGIDLYNASLAWTSLARTSPLDDAPDSLATDTFPLPASFREGTVFCLASSLSPEYSLPPQFDVNSFKSMMRAALVVIPTSDIDPAMTYLTSRVWPGYGW